MAYVKERTDLDLLRELNKQTEYNLSAGQSWVIDKETGSYLSKLGQPIDYYDGEMDTEHYNFYYQGTLFSFTTAYNHYLGDGVVEYKITRSNQPQTSYDKDMLVLLETLFAIDHNYGDILCDKKLSDNKFVISLQF